MRLPREPLATGGGGPIVEMLVVLVTLASAAFAAIAVGWRTDEPDADSGEGADEEHAGADVD